MRQYEGDNIASRMTVRAVGELGRLDRRVVRARFEARFSASRMAREYERAYRD